MTHTAARCERLQKASVRAIGSCGGSCQWRHLAPARRGTPRQVAAGGGLQQPLFRYRGRLERHTGSMTDDVVDLNRKFSLFSVLWSPKLVARLNDYEVKLVKLRGEFVWHTHETTDELFLVIEG